MSENRVPVRPINSNDSEKSELIDSQEILDAARMALLPALDNLIDEIYDDNTNNA